MQLDYKVVFVVQRKQEENWVISVSNAPDENSAKKAKKKLQEGNPAGTYRIVRTEIIKTLVG